MTRRIIAFLLLVLASPLFLFLYLAVKLSSKGPFLFKQLRAGKDKKPFYIYKIRTMAENAEALKKSYVHLNEADGPVFKIRNDPRYTKVGKILSHTGLDELPQLINIVNGEMDFVGPRPFPVNEANKVSGKYIKRFTVLPGITSPWVIKGSHKLSFTQWMDLDQKYIKNKSVLYDIYLLLLTTVIILKSFFPLKNYYI